MKENKSFHNHNPPTVSVPTVQDSLDILGSFYSALLRHGPGLSLRTQYCSLLYIDKQNYSTFLPHTISKVQAKIISQISNGRSLVIFDARFKFSTSTFSLKTGTNELKILLLNVKLMNFRSFFHTWAVLA